MSFKSELEHLINMHFGNDTKYFMTVSLLKEEDRNKTISDVDVTLHFGSYSKLEIKGTPTSEQLRLIALSMEER